MDNNNERELLEQFFHLIWLVRRYQMQHLREHGRMAGPTQGNSFHGQGRILSLLRLKPEISQKDLSNILDIRSQSLGELLAKLERQGYITRTPSEADRRVMEIRLTETGKAAADQAAGEGQAAESRESFFDALTPDEQQTLSSYLARLIQNLQDSLTDGEGERGFPDRSPFGERGFPNPFGRERREPPAGFRGLRDIFWGYPPHEGRR